MSQPQPGFPAVIKHYQLVRTIGQGGMGLVCEGIDRRDGSRVAVKLLFPALAASDPSFAERFEREAHVAALLRSPYTVHVIDFGVEDAATYIVMEFIDGETLAALIRRDPPDAQRALRIAAEIARALEEASARGVVHRDIKPENILIDKAGRVKVTDFGIARALAGPSMTQAGLFLGTPSYAAPEQVDGQVDHRADIYSLGVTLYAMLAGHPPYSGKTPIDVMIQHRSAVLPMAAIAHVPDAVTNIVRRCMEKDPLDRYQTAAELAGALDRARASLSRQEPIVSPSAASSRPAPAPSLHPEPDTPDPRSGQTPVLSAYRGAGASFDAPATQVAPMAANQPTSSLYPPFPAGGPPLTSAPAVIEPRNSSRRLILIGGAAAVVAAVIAAVAVLALSGGGKHKTTEPGGNPTAGATTTAAGTPGASAAATATNVPTVTPPPNTASKLSSGARANPLTCLNLLDQPTESATSKILGTRCPGEQVVVVTNTPPSSTVVVTEGVVFWRVVAVGVIAPGGGQLVGWMKEVTVTGNIRFLALVE